MNKYVTDILKMNGRGGGLLCITMCVSFDL
jgi:hypothetical protein